MNNRLYYRKIFTDAWKKYQAGECLSPLETQLIDIITQHPEYYAMLENPDFSEDFSTDNNPYLHLSLHVGLLEQLSTQRPAGINHLYETRVLKIGDAHKAQHEIMQIMAELMWEAQKLGSMPSDEEYVKKLQLLL
jgi:hypothetical protein